MWLILQFHCIQSLLIACNHLGSVCIAITGCNRSSRRHTWTSFNLANSGPVWAVELWQNTHPCRTPGNYSPVYMLWSLHCCSFTASGPELVRLKLALAMCAWIAVMPCDSSVDITLQTCPATLANVNGSFGPESAPVQCQSSNPAEVMLVQIYTGWTKRRIGIIVFNLVTCASKSYRTGR